MSGGFYLMHRGWMENPIFEDERFSRAQAWEWLIQEANFQPGKYKHPTKSLMVDIDRGQLPTSYRRLAKKWNWSNDRTRHFLDLLESKWMLVRTLDSGFLVITICNYEKYQFSKEAPREMRQETGTRSGTRSGTESEGNYVDTNQELNHDAQNESGTDSGTRTDTPTGTRSGTPYKEKELKEPSDDKTRARVEEIFRELEIIIQSTTPLTTAPVAAWLSWGADPGIDIIPSAQRWKKKYPSKGMNSLTWLDDDVAKSIKQRTKPMPEVEISASSRPRVTNVITLVPRKYRNAT